MRSKLRVAFPQNTRLYIVTGEFDKSSNSPPKLGMGEHNVLENSEHGPTPDDQESDGCSTNFLNWGKSDVNAN